MCSNLMEIMRTMSRSMEPSSLSCWEMSLVSLCYVTILTLEICVVGGSSGSEGSGSGSSSDDSDEDDEEKKKETIVDATETNLISLRRTIYLTIQSALDFEEAVHKLNKLNIKPGQGYKV